jgi:hypothetical protein
MELLNTGLFLLLLIPMFKSIKQLWKLIVLSINGINVETTIENLVYHEGFGGTEGYTEDPCYSFTVKLTTNGFIKSVNCSQYSLIRKDKIDVVYDPNDVENCIFPEYASLGLEFIRCFVGITILSGFMYILLLGEF